jgi:hypothetical protein
MARGSESESPDMNIKTTSLLIFVSLFIKIQPAWAVTTTALDCLPSGQVNQPENIARSPVTPENIFRQSYDKAECLRRAAAAKGAEWLETESLLLQSQQEAEKANWEAAYQLTQKALFQAATALRQVEQEADAWIHRVVD